MLKNNSSVLFLLSLLVCLTSQSINSSENESMLGQASSCCSPNNFLGPFAFNDTLPGASAVSPQGCLSLIQANGSIVSFTIDPTTCSLTQTGIIPFVFIPTSPAGLTYTPDGSCLIAFGTLQSDTTPSVLFFSGASACTLAAPTIKTGTNITAPVSITASNSCITIANACPAPAISGALVDCFSNFENTLTEQFSKVAYSPDGTCLAAIDCSGNVVTFPVNGDCTLGSAVSTIPGLTPTQLAFSPNGNCLVVTQVPASITSFSVSDCALTQVNTTSTDNSVSQISFSPSGSCFALATTPPSFNPSTVDFYSIDPTCNITFVNSAVDFLPSSGRAVAWSPVGNCLFFFTSADLVTYTFPTCLSLAICCKPKIASEGKATYKVSVTNAGPAAAEHIVVTDILPSCFTFKCAQGAGWTITDVGETVTATLPALAAGQTSTFTIKSKTHCCPGNTVTTTATATADGVVTPATASCSSCVR